MSNASPITEEDAALVEAAHNVVQGSPNSTSLVAGEFEGRHTVVFIAQTADIDAARRVVSFLTGPGVVNATLTLLNPTIPARDARGPLYWTKAGQT